MLLLVFSEIPVGMANVNSNIVTIGQFSVFTDESSTGSGVAQLPIQPEINSLTFVVGASSQPITSTEGFNVELRKTDNIVLGTASKSGIAVVRSQANTATSIGILTISCQNSLSIQDIQSQVEENAKNYAMSFTIRTKQPDELILIITAGFTQVYNGYWTNQDPEVNGERPKGVLWTYVQLAGGVWSSIGADCYLAHAVGDYKIDAIYSSTEGAIAMFVIELANGVKTPSSSVISLDFSVYYGEQLLPISIEVPLEKYNKAMQQMENIYAQYPGIDSSVLKKAYYLYLHTKNPVEYQITGISLIKDGQRVADKKMKAEVLADLLTYCYELFPALSKDMLNSYHSYGDEWRELYDNAGLGVEFSDSVFNTATIVDDIGPLIDAALTIYKIKDIGLSSAEQVKSTVSTFYEICHLPYDELIKKYGVLVVNAIFKVLTGHNFISSTDYNPAELYEKFTEDPSDALEVLKEIEKEAFNTDLNPDAQKLISDFLNNLKEEVEEEVISSSALSVWSYFVHGLSASTAAEIGLSSALEGILEGFLSNLIPSSLAFIVGEKWVLPMANAIHYAHESMRDLSNIYYNMSTYGYKIANPENNIFNLTNSRIWSSLAGTEYISEYRYWELTYYYLSKERSTSQSDLSFYSIAAQAALSHAEDWRNALVNILALSQGDVESHDPEGVNFSLEFSPPPTSSPFPVVPKNSSGFVLIANRTSSVTLNSGNYKFIVENRTWFSNFTYSLYVDDAYGNSYLIVFNPPSQQYSVELKNETSVTLKNFILVNGEVKLSDTGKITGKHILFNVVNSQVDSASVKTAWLDFSSFVLILLFSFLALFILLAFIFLHKRG